MIFMGTVYRRSSADPPKQPSVAGEAEISRRNPQRERRIMEETGWTEVFDGTLNLYVDEKVPAQLRALSPLFWERPEDITHPTHPRIPKMRGGYVYYKATVPARDKVQEVLVRLPKIPPSSKERDVALVAPVKLRKHLQIDDGSQVEVEASPTSALASVIEDLAKRISGGSFRSEADISQGVVKQVLHELGWPVFNVQVVAPEFRIGPRNVDYALCHPAGKPAVLLEVKALGKADGKGERQLFEYCFHQGVPIAVLTDGRTWSFFFPAGQGSYEERRFAQINLVEDDWNDSATALRKYLHSEAVRSGEARRRADHDYEAAHSQKEAAAEYASVWRKLLSRPEGLLLDLFSEEVEAATGVRPDRERATAFIRRQVRTDNVPRAVSTPPPKERQREPAPHRPQPASSGSEPSSTKGQELYLDFWQAFQSRVAANSNKLKPRRPQPNPYTSYPIGRSGFKLMAIALLWSSEDQTWDSSELRVELDVEGPDGHRNFDALKKYRKDIEEELTFGLIWKQKPSVQRCRIYVRRTVNLHDRSTWSEYHDWLLHHLLAFDHVFRPRIARL